MAAHTKDHSDSQHTDGPNSKPGHTHSHDTDLTGVSANDHHAQLHAAAHLLGQADAISALPHPGRVKDVTQTALSIPGMRGSPPISTQALAVNTLRYMPFDVTRAQTFDQVVFEVTTAPASNAKVRIGIYAADTDWQPTGAPLLDVEVAVASGFTGVKTTAISVPLPAGRYVGVVNVDVAMTVRSVVGDAIDVGFNPATSANLLFSTLTVASAYGAMPSPTPTPYTIPGFGTTTMRHVLFWRVTTFD